ncbi:glycosyltransferase family 2 protein [Methylotetracoccus oryzae]|uniref:glycosyltransferase family 2 protein n=1 Tax=Methylotetracoccus oryzae TaxID=1919059 RepID=UPI001912DE8D|nr:glycosyltransferase family 2 protein [Methylotetracoccus oryzae]
MNPEQHAPARVPSTRPTPAGSCRLSIVVPCFNEADSLAALHGRLTAVAQRTVGESYEIVLVNDGSTDRTLAAMRALATEDSHLVCIDLARNHGHQLALTAGLALCRGERILIIDADLQDPPELLEEMMNRMDQGADVVYGQRQERHGETWFKKITAALFYRILYSFSSIRIPVDTGDFRLMSRRVLSVLNDMPEQHRFIRGMVAWVGFRQEAVPYVREPRYAGSTKYTLGKMFSFAIDAITGFSTRPLHLSFYLALTAMAGAAALALYALVQWSKGDTIAGWTSLILVVSVFSSIQLFCLGIMGAYLGRTYLEAKRRPLFVIREVITQTGLSSGECPPSPPSSVSLS